MADKQRVRITEDIESLFPGDTLTIGKQAIPIIPLGILQLASITKQLKGFGSILAEEGVNWDNYADPENLLKIATVLLEQFPAVLEEASNIAIEEFQRFPIEFSVEVLEKVISVNMKSKEKLEGNFRSLAGKLGITQKAKAKKK